MNKTVKMTRIAFYYEFPQKIKDGDVATVAMKVFIDKCDREPDVAFVSEKFRVINVDDLKEQITKTCHDAGVNMIKFLEEEYK